MFQLEAVVGFDLLVELKEYGVSRSCQPHIVRDGTRYSVFTNKPVLKTLKTLHS